MSHPSSPVITTKFDVPSQTGDGGSYTLHNTSQSQNTQREVTRAGGRQGGGSCRYASHVLFVNV